MKLQKREYVKYALYDIFDNYVYEGTIKELCEYTGRGEDSLRSTISHIKHERYGRKKILINGKKYFIYKMEN